MSQGPNKLFDDFAKLMTDAAGAAQGLRREAETAFKTQAERFMNEMDVVRREDLEIVREMAAKARAENEELKARIEALEARLAAGGASSAGNG
ncbi:MAG: accessory factor UbiK family protein [Nitratireductor sp.]|nr:accessory factor UbiK family protein [Nitratireductor sp.]